MAEEIFKGAFTDINNVDPFELLLTLQGNASNLMDRQLLMAFINNIIKLQGVQRKQFLDILKFGGGEYKGEKVLLDKATQTKLRRSIAGLYATFPLVSKNLNNVWSEAADYINDIKNSLVQMSNKVNLSRESLHKYAKSITKIGPTKDLSFQLRQKGQASTGFQLGVPNRNELFTPIASQSILYAYNKMSKETRDAIIAKLTKGQTPRQIAETMLGIKPGSKLTSEQRDKLSEIYSRITATKIIEEIPRVSSDLGYDDTQVQNILNNISKSIKSSRDKSVESNSNRRSIKLSKEQIDKARNVWRSTPLLERVLPELREIKDKQLRKGLVNFIKETGYDFFWDVGASSTGTTHPEWARGTSGLLLHNKYMLEAAISARKRPDINNPLHAKISQLPQEDYETLLASIVIHDLQKRQPYTKDTALPAKDENYLFTHALEVFSTPERKAAGKKYFGDRYDKIQTLVEEHMGSPEYGSKSISNELSKILNQLDGAAAKITGILPPGGGRTSVEIGKGYGENLLPPRAKVKGSLSKFIQEGAKSLLEEAVMSGEPIPTKANWSNTAKSMIFSKWSETMKKALEDTYVDVFKRSKLEQVYHLPALTSKELKALEKGPNASLNELSTNIAKLIAYTNTREWAESFEPKVPIVKSLIQGLPETLNLVAQKKLKIGNAVWAQDPDLIKAFYLNPDILDPLIKSMDQKAMIPEMKQLMQLRGLLRLASREVSLEATKRGYEDIQSAIFLIDKKANAYSAIEANRILLEQRKAEIEAQQKKAAQESFLNTPEGRRLVQFEGYLGGKSTQEERYRLLKENEANLLERFKILSEIDRGEIRAKQSKLLDLKLRQENMKALFGGGGNFRGAGGGGGFGGGGGGLFGTPFGDFFFGGGGGRRGGLGGLWFNLQNTFWATSGILTGITSIFSAVKVLTEAIKDNETAVVNLRRVFDGTNEDFEVLASNVTDLAIKYGDTIENAGKIQEEWAKTGKNTADQIKYLSEVTELALNTADIENADMAVRYLNSSLQQMNMNWQDAGKLLDSWNKMADKFPAETRDFAEAYEKSAGYAKNLGLDYNELNTIISILIENTGRSGEEVGTALRMMLSNVFRDKAVKILKDFGIQVYQIGEDGKIAYDKFRPFDEIMADASKKFKELGTAGQSALRVKLASAFGEARYRNMAIALLEGWDKFNEEVKISADSLGYSAKKNELTMNTLAKQALQFKAALTELAVVMGEAGLLPALKSLNAGSRDLLVWFNNLDPMARQLVLTFASLEGGLALVNAVVSKLNNGMSVSGALINSMSSKLIEWGAHLKLFNIQANFPFDEIIQTLMINEDMMKAFVDRKERIEAILEAFEQMGISRQILEKSVKAETAELIRNSLATTANAAAKNQLTLSINRVAAGLTAARVASFLFTQALLIGIPLLITYLLTAKKAAEERARQSREEAQRIRDNQAQLSPLIKRYEELESKIKDLRNQDLSDHFRDQKVASEELTKAQEDLLQVKREIANIEPALATGIDEEGNRIADNIDLIKQYQDHYLGFIKLRDQLAAQEYAEQGPKLETRRKELMDQYNKLGTAYAKAKVSNGPEQYKLLLEALGYDTGFQSHTNPQFTIPLSDLFKKAEEKLENYRKELQEVLTKQGEMIEGFVNSIRESIEAQDKSALGTTMDEFLQNMSKSIDAYTELKAEQESFADSVESVYEAINVLDSSTSRSTSRARAALEVIKDFLPGVLEIEKKSTTELRSLVEQEIKDHEEYTRTRIENSKKVTENDLKQVEARIEGYMLEVDAIRMVMEVLQNLEQFTSTAIGRSELRAMEMDPGLRTNKYLAKYAGGGLTDSEQKELKARMQIYEDYINKANQLKARINDARNEAYRVLVGGTKYDKGITSTSNSDKYKMMNVEIEKLDNNAEEIADKLSSLDKIWEGQTSNIDYLKDKIALLNEQERILINNISELEKKEKSITGTEAEDLRQKETIRDKIRQYNKTLFDIQATVVDVDRAKFDLYIQDIDRGLNRINSVFEMVTSGINETTKSTVYAEAMQYKYNSVLNLYREKQLAYTTEMSRMRAEMELNSRKWFSATETEKQILHARNEYLRKTYKEMEQTLLEINVAARNAYIEYRGYIRNIILEGYEDAKNQRLKVLQEKWDEEDYQERIDELDKKIAQKRAELNKIALDDSQWAAKRRIELEAEIRDLEKQQSDEEKQRSREEEQKAIEEQYEELKRNVDDLLNDVLDMVGSNQDDIIDLLDKNTDRFGKIGDAYKSALLEALEGLGEGIQQEINLGLAGVDIDISDNYTPTRHDSGLSGEEYNTMMSNKARWWELYYQGYREATNAEMQRLHAENDAIRKKYGKPWDWYPSYGKGGVAPEDQLALLHKREMVLPEKYTDILDNLLKIPVASIPRELVSNNTINNNTAHIDNLIRIDHADFSDEFDYDSLENHAGVSLKKTLFKQGIKLR